MSVETKIKIGADTSEIEKAFATLIKKIQGDADKLKLGTTSTKSRAPTEKTPQDVYRENLESTRNKEKTTRLDQQALQIANRALEEKKRTLEAIKKYETESVKNEKEKAEWAKARNKAEEDYNSILKTRDRLKASTGKGTSAFKVPSGGITNLSDLMKMLGVPGIALAGVGTALAIGKAAEGTRRFVDESQFRNREIEAQAYQRQGQGGQRLGSILNGGAAEDLTFNAQRIQASGYADKFIEDRYKNNPTSPQSLLMEALIGKKGSGALQHMQLMQAGRYGVGRLLDAVGVQNSLVKEAESTKMDERNAKQEEQFNAIKNGPEGATRTAVANRHLQTYQTDLATQRQLGLSDEGLRGNAYGTSGGFFGKANDAGFTNDQARAAAGNIIGAGGSTRSARGNAVDALKAERNLDITNASQIFGKLSGSIGSDTGSKDAFIKILAEGTKIGLDGSQYREENRKFIESAATIVGKSGATSSEGLDQILNVVGKFFGGDKTTRGIEAGQNAYELYRQKSVEQSGPTGTMRAAGIIKNPVLNKLDTFSRAALFNIPIDQLTSDNPAVQALAANASRDGKPVSPEQIIEEANKVTAASQNKFKQSDTSIQKLKDIKKKYGLTSALDTSGLTKEQQKEVSLALGQAQVNATVENPDLGKDFRFAGAYVDAQSSGDAKGQMKALEDAKKAQLDAGVGPRAGDTTNAAQAQGDKLFNNLFSSLQTQIVPTKAAIDGLAQNIKDLVTIMNTSSDAVAKAKAVTGLNNLLGMPTQAPNQQSAGPPSPSGGH
jgi:hypothetical protein